MLPPRAREAGGGTATARRRPQRAREAGALRSGDPVAPPAQRTGGQVGEGSREGRRGPMEALHPLLHVGARTQLQVVWTLLGVLLDL